MEQKEAFCEKHGPYISHHFVFKKGSINMDCWEMCSKCVEVFEAENNLIETEESKVKRQNEKYKAMGIPLMYKDSTWQNYKIKTESQKKAANSCLALKQRKIDKVFMLGDSGQGKTHLAIATLKEFGKGKYYTEYKLAQLKRECESFSSKTTVTQLIEELASTPLLVIDELGRVQDTRNWSDFLAEVIDERHANFKPMILITNYTTKSQCVNHDNCSICDNRVCIESRLDNNILSRLRQDSEVIRMKGEDFRKNNSSNISGYDIAFE